MQTITLSQLHTILRNAFVLCEPMEADGTAGRQFVQQAEVFASLQRLYYEWEYKLNECKCTAVECICPQLLPLDEVCNTIVQHLIYWDDEWEYYFTNVCAAPDVAQYKWLSS